MSMASNEVAKYLKSFDITKAKTVLTIVIVLIIIWVLIEFGGDFSAALNSVMTWLGVKESPAQAAADATVSQQSSANASSTSPWNPALYNNNPDASTLDYQTLVSMAETIYGTQENWALLRFNSDPTTAFAQIKQCNNKIDVSNLVVVFQQEYSEDLYTFMSSNYNGSSSEVIFQQIINFVNNLPNT